MTKALNNVVVVFVVVFHKVHCLKVQNINIWQGIVGYYMFQMNITNDTPKIIDNLEIILLHSLISYFWWGDRNRIFIKAHCYGLVSAILRYPWDTQDTGP